MREPGFGAALDEVLGEAAGLEAAASGLEAAPGGLLVYDGGQPTLL